MIGVPRWLTVLEEPLPVRVRASAPQGGDTSWTTGIATALVSLSAACPPEQIAAVGEALIRHVERRTPKDAEKLRDELDRRRDIRGLCRGLQPLMLRGLEGTLSPRGQGLLPAQFRDEGEEDAPSPHQCLQVLLGAAGLSALAHEIGVSGEAWSRLESADRAFILDICTPMVAWSPEDGPRPSTSQDAWLRWIHGRRWRWRGRVDPADLLTKVAKGRPHHFATLLLALAACTGALFDVVELGTRLSKRGEGPSQWQRVVDRMLHRLPLLDAASEQEDIRGVPLLKAVATWGRLGGGESATRLHEAVDRMVRELSPPKRGGRGRTHWPAARFERGDQGFEPLLSSDLASDPARLWWINEIVLGLRRGALTGPLGALSQPQVRACAAMAHALHDCADNFAARVFPSVNLWRSYYEGPLGAEDGVEGWMKAHGDDILLPGRRALAPELTGWSLSDEDGCPWSASRLFIEATRAHMRGESGLPEHLFRASSPRARAAVPSLLETLRRFLKAAAEDATGVRAARREAGVRWTSTEWIHVEPEFDDDIGQIEIPDHRPAQQMERLSGDREEDDEEAPRDAPGTRRLPTPWTVAPCDRCAILSATLEEDPRWIEADRPRQERRLAPGFRLLHEALHASRLDGVCPECAAQLLPFAADALESQADALLEDLGDEAGPAPAACARLLDDLRAAVVAFHRSRHASASPSFEEPSARAEPLVVQLTVGRAQARATARIDGQLRSELEPLRGAEADFARAMIDEALPRVGPDAPEALTRLLGATLGSLMLQRGIGGIWNAALQHARAFRLPVRLCLVSEGDTARYPWELMCDPASQGGYLALERDIQIVRVLSLSAPVRRLASPAPPRVLFATAGLPPGVTSREIETLRRADVSLQVLEAATLPALLEALQAGPWSVLHLACHGKPGLLRLHDQAPLDAHTLAELVHGRVSDAVILNACWGARATRPSMPGADWSSVAGALLERGVPHVVGAVTPLLHADALALADAWHAAFLAHGDPVAATSAARRAVRDRHPHRPAFALIQHFTTAQGGP